jgi:hypothetical protein
MTEIEEIERRYDSGELDPIKRDLERFLVAHRTDIAESRAQEERKGSAISESDAVKLYILRYRSINPGGEIREQLEEIQREKWIRGVESGCSPDAEQVALEWARRYSAAWRQHRLTTILYVFERERERYLKLLNC